MKMAVKWRVNVFLVIFFLLLSHKSWQASLLPTPYSSYPVHEMSLSPVKKAVQRTEDGLTGFLVPHVWEVDDMFSSHWHSQECILLRSSVGLITLRKAQEAEKESTVLSREGFCGWASLGFCVAQSWVKEQYWMNKWLHMYQLFWIDISQGWLVTSA